MRVVAQHSTADVLPPSPTGHTAAPARWGKMVSSSPVIKHHRKLQPFGAVQSHERHGICLPSKRTPSRSLTSETSSKNHVQAHVTEFLGYTYKLFLTFSWRDSPLGRTVIQIMQVINPHLTVNQSIRPVPVRPSITSRKLLRILASSAKAPWPLVSACTALLHLL